MKPSAIVIICAGLLAVQFARGQESTNKLEKMTMPNILELTDSTVLKVFSAEGGGAKYKAYLVKWKDQEVVVTDMFGGPELKEGDTVKVMAQVVDLPTAGIKMLQFVYFDMNSMMSRALATQGSNNVKKNVGTVIPPPQSPRGP